jgi:hypothetical protein
VVDGALPRDLSTVEQWPIEDVRAARAELQEVETGLSYVRRVVQGRLDIVNAELARRRDGGEPGDLRALIEELPSILGEHLRAPGVGRLPTGVGEGAVDPELEARLADATVAGDDLPGLADDALAALGTRLGDLEREVSDRRHDLFASIDALQAELTRRYRTGEADVESLLR